MPGEDELAVLDELLSPEGRRLVDSLTPYDPSHALDLVVRARREPLWVDRPEVVAAAATQARLRTRASVRFPGPPRWWTPQGLEQATRPALAARHARRYAGVTTRVVDLGCGAGSDSLALAERGISVLAVDRDVSALWALAATARDRGLPVEVRHADISGPGPWNGPGQPAEPHGKQFGCFVDPARRAAAGRILDPQRWSPPWSWVVALAGRHPATGAKVAPGIAHEALPPGTQTEWTSTGSELLEAAVWWGPLRQGPARRAALAVARDGSEARLDDTDGVPSAAVGELGEWVTEPDPAVIRAGLVSVLAERVGGRLLDSRIAYITTDVQPPPSPLGTRFRVLAEVPFARKQMRAWLRARGFGDVVVKKRGLDLAPEQVRASLRLVGDGPTATLILTRTDSGPRAMLVQRAEG